MNKKIITAFLAALLAVGAAGCGDVKEQGAADNGGEAPVNNETEAVTTTTAAETAAPETTTTEAPKELTVDDAAKVVENKLDSAQKAAKGELEGGCKAVITYKAPATGELAEKGIKPFTITVDGKVKDKLTGVSYVVGYDSKDLLTINAVYDNENGNAYAVIPELSDAVLTGSAQDIETMMTDSLSAYTAGAASYVGDQNVANAQGTPDLSALQNIDVEALGNDIATYADTVKENFPEGKEAAPYSVSADGVTIELKTKSFTVTPDDAKKLTKALADKGLADETLKGAFSAAGISDDDYKNLWSSLTTSDENAETMYFDLYYTAEDMPCGFAIKSDETKVENYLVCASTEKDLIIDSNLGDQVSEKSIKGHLSYDKETLDGKLTVTDKSENSETKFVMSYDNLTVSDNKVVGSYSMSMTMNGQEFMNMTYTFDVSDNGGMIKITGSSNGQDIGEISMDMQNTDASDVKIPTGTTYKFTDNEQMQKYTEGCKVEEWQETVKSALGEDLYNEVFGAQQVDYSTLEQTEVTANAKESA